MTSDVLIFLMLALTGVEANNIDTDDSIPGSTQRTFLGSASVVVNNDGTCGAHCKYSNSYCYPEGERCLYGCEMGWTGDDCSHPCNMHRCVDCYLDTCTICSEGYYGDKCQHSCNTNCVLERCDRNGNCLYGCEKGWMGNKCTDKDCPFANCELCALNYDDELYCLRCKPGWYFNSFICEVCSSGCKVQEGALTQCNSSTGECLNGCVDKWYGFRCNDQCTISNCRTCVKKWAANILTCSECEEGYFSAQDERSCITCTGHCLNGPTRCDVVTGYCIGGCQPGYFGGRCDQICDIDHCQECESLASSLDVSCASCDTGYYWNPTGLCVPCSTNCREGLLQCDSKTGECLTGCVGGYYGPKCNFVCSAHCSTPNCSMNGNCLGDCVIGYFGDRCDRNCPENCQASCDGFIDGVCSECEAGFYGPTCENKCSENCRRSDQNNYIYCNKSTGDCSNGCPGGRWGPSCNKFCSENCYAQICSQSTGACRVCTQWWYGESCEKKCNANCFYSSAADDRACHITSGECINGCKPGYYGLFCSEPCEGMCENSKCEQENGTCEGCSNGYHGTYCGLECPTNCKHSTCSREMGKCTHGCDDGFHGENCSLKCNPYCKTSCSQLTGDCARGCVAGWYGERCSNPCAPGQYGEECLEICGTCRGNSPCDRFDGSCISGCDIGWTGTLCLERNQVDHFPETAEAQTVVDNKSIVIGGSISGVIVLLAIISSIIFLVFKRKQRKKQRKPEAVANDFQLQEMSGSPNLSAHHHFVKSRSLALTKDSVHIEEHIIMEGHFSDFHRGKFNDGKQSHVVTVKCCHGNTFFPDLFAY